MIRKPLTIVQRFLIALISPDILGVGIIGFLIVWLVGIPFSNSIQKISTMLSGSQSISPLLEWSIDLAIVSLIIFILFRSKRLFTLIVAAFIVSWFLWSGVVQNYSQLPWWRLFEVNLPTPQFIVDRVAKIFILLLGGWTFISLHRFRSLRQELQKNGATIEDIQKVFLFSTFVLSGSAIMIGGIVYFSLLLIS